MLEESPPPLHITGKSGFLRLEMSPFGVRFSNFVNCTSGHVISPQKKRQINNSASFYGLLALAMLTVLLYIFIMPLQSSIPLWLLYSSLGRMHQFLPDVVFSGGFSSHAADLFNGGPRSPPFTSPPPPPYTFSFSLIYFIVPFLSHRASLKTQCTRPFKRKSPWASCG